MRRRVAEYREWNPTFIPDPDGDPERRLRSVLLPALGEYDADRAALLREVARFHRFGQYLPSRA